MSQTPKPAKLDDLFRAKRGTAVLAACIVQTLNESDDTFQERFLKRLSEAYYEIRDNQSGDWGQDVLQELELLSWTRSYLTGVDFVRGQGEPFLSNYTPK